MIVDHEKLAGMLLKIGVVKHVDTLYRYSCLKASKKKAKRAVKQLINKCLIRHSVAQKMEEAIMEGDYRRDMEQDNWLSRRNRSMIAEEGTAEEVNEGSHYD